MRDSNLTGSWAVARNGADHAFINHFAKFVRAKNRTMIVWEGFDPDPGSSAAAIDTSVVVSPFNAIMLLPWPHRPHHYFAAGYSIINTDWNPLYLVHGKWVGPETLADW